MSMNNDLAIIISSCDSYCDAWQPMIDSINEQFHDLESDVFLITESVITGDSRVTVINIGYESTFGHRLSKALEMLSHKYVLLLFDDFIVTKGISQTLLKDYCDIITKNQISCLYIDYYRSQRTKGIGKYQKVNLSKRYSIDLSIALWNKEFLLSLIDTSWSPWEFEKNARKSELNKNSLIWSVTSSFSHSTIKRISPAGLIIKGKYTRMGLAYLKEYNYLTTNRDVETKFEEYITSKYTTNVVKWFPFYVLMKISKIWKKKGQ